MEDKHDYQNGFLDVFKKELTEKIQILEKGLSKLEYEYARENVDLLMDTIGAIKEKASFASFPVLVELAQAMEDVFVYVRHGELSLDPAQVDRLFQADAIFRSVLRQGNNNVSAWLVERDSYISRVMQSLWDFVPTSHREKAINGKHERKLTRETREDAEEKKAIPEAVASTPDVAPQEELAPKWELTSAASVSPAAALELESREEEMTPAAIIEPEDTIPQEEPLPPLPDDFISAMREMEHHKEEGATDREEEVADAEVGNMPDSSEDVKEAEPAPEPDIDPYEPFLFGTPLYSDQLLRLAAESLVQTRRFRRRYPIFEEIKKADPAQQTMASYFSSKAVRQHLEFLTEELCEAIMLQNKVPLAAMIHQFSARISRLTAPWNRKVDFVTDDDAILLDARILTELSGALWPFIRAVLVDSVETPVENSDGKRNFPVNSLLLAAEEKAEMIHLSLLIENYHFLEPGETGQDDQFQTNQKAVQNMQAALCDQVVSLGGAIDCVPSEKGTEVIMQLPVSFSMVPCLLVQIQGESYALPLTHVERSLDSAREILISSNEGYTVVQDGEHVLCVSGQEIFPSLIPADDRQDNSEIAVIVLRDGQSRYGLIVDASMGKESLVLYPLDQRLGTIRGVLGTAMLADGSPTLIINAQELFSILKEKTS